MIYVVKHKPYDCPVREGYKDIYVGDMYKGDNPVNRYNKLINETTAMWDIYDTGDDIVGLVHYRRTFDDLSFDRAKQILNEYDVITTPDHSPETPYQHLIENLDRDLVDKYINQLPLCVQNWFHEHNAFNICNMFVAKREFLKGYLDFIEPVLSMAEQFEKEDLSENVKQNRLLGFICECLFGYYCKDLNKYRIPIRNI